MKFSSVLPALMVIVMVCMGQSIQISGTVKDSATGAAIKNAIVRLAQNGLADTTDNAGNFLLMGMGTNLMVPDLGIDAPVSPVSSSSGEIRFTLHQEERVAIRAYSVQGRQLYSIRKTLQAGAHSVLPKQLPAGIYYYKIEIGNAVYTLAQIHIDGATNIGGMAKTVHGAEEAQPSAALSKQANSLAALQDSIVVTATGHKTKRVSVTQTEVTGLVIKVVASMPAKKWHPGFWMQLTRGSGDLVQSTRFGYYNAIASNTHIVGVVVPLRWSQLEGAVQGDYAAGIALVRAEIDKLKSLAVPKRLFIRIIDLDYGNKTGNSGYFPQYIRNSYLVQGTGGVFWCRWNAAAMGYFIAMWQAYAAAFDSDPYFEGLYLIRETAAPVSGTPSNYSDAALDAQLRRLEYSAAAAFVRSNVVMPINFLGTQSMTDAHMAYMKTVPVGMGSPDVMPPACVNRDLTWGDKTVQGLSGGHDYRGEIPILYSAEATEMSLDSWGFGNCLPAQLRDFANNSLRASHLFLDRNTFTGTPETQWDTGILPYINNPANALTHTGCPSVYTQGCDTN